MPIPTPSSSSRVLYCYKHTSAATFQQRGSSHPEDQRRDDDRRLEEQRAKERDIMERGKRLWERRGSPKLSPLARPAVSFCHPHGPPVLTLPAATSSSPPRKKAASAAKEDPRRSLPWERSAPTCNEHFCGNKEQRASIKDFLKNWKRIKGGGGGGGLLQEMLLITGPPGSGKSYAARYAAATLNFVATIHDPSSSENLGFVVRNISAVDCNARRVCLIIEEVAELYELYPKDFKCGAPEVPVIGICNVAPASLRKTRHSIAFYALRAWDTQELVARVCRQMGARCSEARMRDIVSAGNGDIRQILTHVVMTQASTTTACMMPFAAAKAILSGTTAVAASDALDYTVRCLHANVARLPDVDIERLASFTCILAETDAYPDHDLVYHVAGMSARQCVAPSFYHGDLAAPCMLTARRPARLPGESSLAASLRCFKSDDGAEVVVLHRKGHHRKGAVGHHALAVHDDCAAGLVSTHGVEE